MRQCHRITIVAIVMTVAVAIIAAAGGRVANAATLFGVQTTGGASTLYTIDPATGVATFVGAIGFNGVSGIDYDPVTGFLYGTGFDPTDSYKHKLATIATGSGVGTAVGTGTTINTSTLQCDFGAGPQACGEFNVTDLSFRSDGTLFAYLDADALATISTGTGIATIVGIGFTNVPDTCNGGGMAFSPSDSPLYSACQDFSSAAHLNTLNPATAQATFYRNIDFSAPINADKVINAMDYDPDTGVLYASVEDSFGENYLVTLDPTALSGLVNVTSVVPITAGVGGLNLSIDAIAWVPVAVPEPGTLILLGAGLSLLAISRRKQG